MKLFDIKNIFESEDKNSKYTVAIDMDGVVADFEAGVHDVFGKSIDQMETRDLWKGIARYDKHEEPFFENLPAMKDAHQLMNFITSNFNNYFILTASGYTPKNVEEQKRKWIAKVFSPMLGVEVVRKSADKAQFATPNTILIDDRKKSTEPFKAAGGKAILHKNAQATIEQLEQYLNEEE